MDSEASVYGPAALRPPPDVSVLFAKTPLFVVLGVGFRVSGFLEYYSRRRLFARQERDKRDVIVRV